MMIFIVAPLTNSFIIVFLFLSVPVFVFSFVYAFVFVFVSFLFAFVFVSTPGYSTMLETIGKAFSTYWVITVMISVLMIMIIK